MYRSAAHSSGFTDLESSALKREALDFVESYYLRRLPKKGEEVFSFLLRDQNFDPKQAHSKLARSLAQVLSPQLSQEEREFYRRHLLNPDSAPLQSVMWNHIREVNRNGDFDWNEPFSLEELSEIQKKNRRNGNSPLAQRLDEIRNVEVVIGPAVKLFGFLLSRDGQYLHDVAEEVRTSWGANLIISPTSFAQILQGLDVQLTAEMKTLLCEVAGRLCEGRHKEAIELLLNINSDVMKERGASPWLTIKSRRLDVRLPEEMNELPEKEEMRHPWVNQYFLNSLKRIGFQIEGN